MPKRDYSLTQILRRDLFTAYRDVYVSCHSQDEAWDKTVNHIAPRYYVTPKQAYKILRPMVQGDFSLVDKMIPNKRRMYYCMFERLQEMSQRTSYAGKSLWFICQFLVCEQAPEFFISKLSASMIFSNCKRHGLDYKYYDVYKDNRK